MRLAVGSTPRHLLVHVLGEGALLVAIGIVAGVTGSYAVGRAAEACFDNLRLPGVLPVLGAAAVLGDAAVVAWLMPAARAARVDVRQAGSALARGRGASEPLILDGFRLRGVPCVHA